MSKSKIHDRTSRSKRASVALRSSFMKQAKEGTLQVCQYMNYDHPMIEEFDTLTWSYSRTLKGGPGKSGRKNLVVSVQDSFMYEMLRGTPMDLKSTELDNILEMTTLSDATVVRLMDVTTIADIIFGDYVYEVFTGKGALECTSILRMFKPIRGSQVFSFNLCSPDGNTLLYSVAQDEPPLATTTTF